MLSLIVWIGACLAAGGIGSLATSESVDAWYRTIEKPSWNPPSMVFGPVWTTLYVVMGIAAWLVWQKKGWSTPIYLFIIQLALNAAWSPIFFALQSPMWAFVEICVFWLFLLATVVAFFKARFAAGMLLIPYIAWVTFAAVLNYTIWHMNS